jgi:lipoprotein-anchoring transpeptidase ErfK/SrfK
MTEISGISRRDFLKFGGVALAGLVLPPRLLSPGFPPPAEVDVKLDEQGRVTDNTLSVYNSPSFAGKIVNSYWKDLVIPITGVAVSDDETAYNRVWYRIGDEGYAYSGAIQPVKTILNTPADSIPSTGELAEVTVPFTDAYQSPDPAAQVVYRLCYSTTYWITSIEHDATGNAWYRFYDDKDNADYFVQAAHLRIVPAEELSPISPTVAPELKLLEVRLIQQLVVAYEDDKIVFVTRAATGNRIKPHEYSTPIGWHRTYHKRPTRHMAAGNLANTGYDLPGIPWVCYITESGVSFHGTYWHNDFGRPRSHGCINLTPQAAKWIYRWTNPTVPPDKWIVYHQGEGTSVRIIE